MEIFTKTKAFVHLSFIVIWLLFPFFNLFCQYEVKNKDHKKPFSVHWHFTCQNNNYNAQIPGSIYTDLLRNHLIQDPFFGSNEDSLQWISQQEWEYSTVFNKEDVSHNRYNELVFNGINGYALFYLNEKPLLRQENGCWVNFTDNAFRSYRFVLPQHLKKRGNKLTIRFIPIHKIIAERAAALHYILPDNRAFLRIPPYQSGWDWGPTLPDCGIWKSIELYSWNKFKIEDLQIYTHLVEKRAEITVHTQITSHKKVPVNIHYYLNDKLIGIQEKIEIKDTSIIAFPFHISHPKLWETNGTGNQPLYHLRVEVSKDKEIEKIEKRFGLRTVALDTRSDSIGTAFTFIVNGKPVFMKGANWIPADFFPYRVSPEKYRTLLQSCKEANINMLRVWGGGIYEDDLFYDLCDELGILVWQDFMFACALYPADSTFLQNVAKEAQEQILRLRNHPSLALWCGNNEVKNGWEDWGWQTQYEDSVRQEIDQNQQLIFNTLLAKQVEKYDNARSYHSSSPLWGWGHQESLTQGDSHYWGIWWGEEPFEMWKNKVGRFMSEFGFQSYPQMSVIEQFTNEKERDLSSPAMQNHQKHAKGRLLIGQAMQTYFYEPDNLKDFLYISQLTQAFGIGQALEVFRLRMPYCMGSLYWQLNDCWPVASWSSIDYYNNWKALHFEVKRQYQNLIIACDTFCQSGTDIYVVNDNLSPISGNCGLRLIDFQGRILSSENINFTAQANQSTFLTHYQLPQLYDNLKNRCFLQIVFKDNRNKVLAEKVHFFLYPKSLELKAFHTSLPYSSPCQELQSGLNFIRATDTTKTYTLTLRSPHLQYGVAIEANVPCHFSDNWFLLLPNEEKKIILTANSSKTDDIRFTIRSFGK